MWIDGYTSIYIAERMNVWGANRESSKFSSMYIYSASAIIDRYFISGCTSTSESAYVTCLHIRQLIMCKRIHFTKGTYLATPCAALPFPSLPFPSLPFPSTNDSMGDGKGHPIHRGIMNAYEVRYMPNAYASPCTPSPSPSHRQDRRNSTISICICISIEIDSSQKPSSHRIPLPLPIPLSPSTFPFHIFSLPLHLYPIGNNNLLSRSNLDTPLMSASSLAFCVPSFMLIWPRKKARREGIWIPSFGMRARISAGEGRLTGVDVDVGGGGGALALALALRLKGEVGRGVGFCGAAVGDMLSATGREKG